MSKNLFIIGTGTDIGKTYIAALILKKLRENYMNPGYFKAAMSGNSLDSDGNIIPGDSLYIMKISNIDEEIEKTCPYIYKNPFSPHLASRIEGNPVKMSYLMEKFREINNRYDYLVIEGSGGIICPISLDNEEIWLTDIIKVLESPCLLVADAGLGTINYIGLTIKYLKDLNIPINGIILNNYEIGNIMHEDNLKVVERLTGINVVGKVRRYEEDLDMDLEDLESLFE